VFYVVKEQVVEIHRVVYAKMVRSLRSAGWFTVLILAGVMTGFFQ